MARQRVDAAAIKTQLLHEAERMLAETHGRRLVISEIAARIGMSQSYAHRFFPTKADLVRELASRWFQEIEGQSSRIAALDLPPGERLERWVLGILSLKRDLHDADQKLFNAYLELAADHMDVVAEHVSKLSRDLKQIVSGLVPPGELEDTVAMVEDATMLFRVPSNISRFRDRATDTRAKVVVDALRRAIGHR
ncbi:TetR family transcriptional regulator [Microvirga roseola]|uniref:TetR family transcriptional regulator n=1 Tax=Microvirga roseola TaxID=2883126 RepID=UPI001E640D0D|nr:TetR family transcriptional regulator [Microvirga roseola]